jgi:signal transduction histidine kinase
VPENRASRQLNGNAAAQKLWRELVAPMRQALEILQKHQEEIEAAWKAAQRASGLTPAQLDALTGSELSAMKSNLRPGRWRSLRHNILSLGEHIAALGISFEEALTAYRSRMEICLPYLETKAAARTTPAAALLRYWALFAAHLSLGYERQRVRETTRISTRNAQPSVTEAYECERRQLSHDLHDEIGHELMLLKLNLETLKLDFKQQDTASTAAQLEQAIAVVERAIASVRRIVLTLGPTILEELGFVPAIEYYAHRFAQTTGIETTVNVGKLPERIPVSYQVALYRVLQGALSNVLKHAHARHVAVNLGPMSQSTLIMVVQDDGVGFDTHAPRSPASVGLTAMRERVEFLRGRFHIKSRRKGTQGRSRGTRIEIDLPLCRSHG